MKILVSPLNWGLGHASRCIPVIEKLLLNGDTVVIAGDGAALELLKQTFPGLESVRIPSFSMRYSAGSSQVWAILRALPSIVFNTVREHRLIRRIVAEYQIDEVISDNRFGLWCKGCRSVYITHQILVRMPDGLRFLEPVGYRMHGWFIRHYDECWIPDNADMENNLSGNLSHLMPIHANCRFIGPLSRFKGDSAPIECKVLAILSGVEPHRSMLERRILDSVRDDCVLVRGVYGNLPVEGDVPSNFTVYDNIPADKLEALLRGAELIICRSGYSSIMDLERLSLLDRAVLIPTPGQPEQEYLAHWLSNRVSTISSDTILPMPGK